MRFLSREGVFSPNCLLIVSTWILILFFRYFSRVRTRFYSLTRVKLLDSYSIFKNLPILATRLDSIYHKMWFTRYSTRTRFWKIGNYSVLELTRFSAISWSTRTFKKYSIRVLLTCSTGFWIRANHIWVYVHVHFWTKISAQNNCKWPKI